MQANLNRKPCEPIFNAFQPSISTDISLFIGRKKEVEEVYSKGQIYMHQLQQKSCQNTEPGSPVPFTNELVEESGPPALHIDEFISSRITELKEEQGQTEDPVKKGILAREIDELENSRVQCGCGDKKQAVAAAAVVVPPIIGVPWWLFIPLMAIPLFG
ncbi:MAG: hypothetical protein ACJAZ9_001652 [Neolewinella sp.]|jgi:hypothetical protein